MSSKNKKSFTNPFDPSVTTKTPTRLDQRNGPEYQDLVAPFNGTTSLQHPQKKISPQTAKAVCQDHRTWAHQLPPLEPTTTIMVAMDIENRSACANGRAVKLEI
jgi:hypothetical protein